MKKIILILVLFVLICAGSLIGSYFLMIKAPSKESNTVNLTVNKGDNYNSIVGILKEKNLIKNRYAYKIYIKLNPPTKSLEAGEYELNTNLSVEELIKEFEKGTKSRAQTIRVKFLEGKNMRSVIKTITSNFSISEDEILNK